MAKNAHEQAERPPLIGASQSSRTPLAYAEIEPERSDRALPAGPLFQMYSLSMGTYN